MGQDSVGGDTNGSESNANQTGPLPVIATGNWGCGAFNGDPVLKGMIQMVAAAQAERGLLYLTFGDETLRKQLEDTFRCQP